MDRIYYSLNSQSARRLFYGVMPLSRTRGGVDEEPIQSASERTVPISGVIVSNSSSRSNGVHADVEERDGIGWGLKSRARIDRQVEEIGYAPHGTVLAFVRSADRPTIIHFGPQYLFPPAGSGLSPGSGLNELIWIPGDHIDSRGGVPGSMVVWGVTSVSNCSSRDALLQNSLVDGTICSRSGLCVMHTVVSKGQAGIPAKYPTSAAATTLRTRGPYRPWELPQDRRLHGLSKPGPTDSLTCIPER